MEKKIIVVGDGGAGMPHQLIQALTAKMPNMVVASSFEDVEKAVLASGAKPDAMGIPTAMLVGQPKPMSHLAMGNMIHGIIESVETALNKSMEIMDNLEVEVDGVFLSALEYLTTADLPERPYQTAMGLLERGGFGFVDLVNSYRTIDEQSEVIMEMGDESDFIPCTGCTDCGDCHTMAEGEGCDPADCADCSYQCNIEDEIHTDEVKAEMREFLKTVPQDEQEHILDTFKYEVCGSCPFFDKCEKVYVAMVATAEQVTEDDFNEKGEPKITVVSARYPEDFFCKSEQANVELLEDNDIQVLVNSAAAVKLSPSRQYAVFGRGDTTVFKLYQPDGTERMFVCQDVQMADSDEFSYKIDLPLEEYHTLNGGMVGGEFKVPAPETLGLERQGECSAKAKDGEDMPEGCIGCPKQDECYQ